MKPLLEILIPTFNRNESAEASIKSVLDCNDQRLTVRCNSNGYEPNLEKFRNFNSRVKYDCFESNRGPKANNLKLFNETNAKFCMLLSDEDRVNNMNYENILNFLENIDKNTQVIACSIFDKTTNDYYWKPSLRIMESNIHNYVALSPLSTYMTGLIFRVKSLKAIDINALTSLSDSNAYSHLDITLYMLRNGNLKFFHERFVEKGADIKFGGDGYSHKLKNSTKNSIDNKNMDLNPSIYGPKARARQFYYRENLLNKLKSEISPVSIFIGKLNYIDFFYRSIMRADQLVILPKKTLLKNETMTAYLDSKNKNENSGSTTASFFKLLLRLPGFIANPLFFILSSINKLIRMAYMMKLTLVQKNYKD
ncbi:MAG: hypothetical protein CMN00_08725 [Rickettsiales bacterium]|nr:hypothetical protein [Rickettsiales bacterium]|tara:strand:- start:39 stop:1136 length:1098 start_codon:yes stop_codon:yes gene_type:complete